MRAIILAAGQGSRLGHSARDLPKCMVPVLGKPMVESALEALAGVGVTDVVLVTGHLEGTIKNYLGSAYGDVRLTYVSNDDYATTNNIYSLWLARHLMDRDTLLLECDLVFDHDLISRLVRTTASDVAVVDRYQAYMDGTVVFATEAGVAHSMVLKREQGDDFDYGSALKTVNIYKFSSVFLKTKLIPALSEAIDSQRTDNYYEAEIARLIRAGELELDVMTADDLRWAEIDTQHDLEFAREIFGISSRQRLVGS